MTESERPIGRNPNRCIDSFKNRSLNRCALEDLYKLCTDQKSIATIFNHVLSEISHATFSQLWVREGLEMMYFDFSQVCNYTFSIRLNVII